MVTNEMIALVQAQVEAYNSRDIESFCRCYHDEVHIYELFTGKLKCSSLEHFKSIYETMFAGAPDLHGQIKNRIVLGSTVIDEEWVTGSPNHPNGLHAVAIYAFRDGKISQITFAT